MAEMCESRPKSRLSDKLPIVCYSLIEGIYQVRRLGANCGHNCGSIKLVLTPD